MAAIIDGRDMLPPEPLERVIDYLPLIAGGDELVVLLHCRPLPLYDILRQHGYVWRETFLSDGTWEICVRRMEAAE